MSMTATERRSRQWLVAGVIVTVAIFLAIDPQWTTQSIKPPAQSAATSSGNFNPSDYVRKHWAGEILPTVLHKAVDISTLLADLKSNASRTAKRYGHVAELGGQPTFLVKGTAHVVSVNTSNIPAEAVTKVGTTARPNVDIQLGPILTGTDVRDAMKFISFNQFQNQVTYSELATAINSKIEDTALSKIENKKLVGKTVTFHGAFTYTPGMTPFVTPVTLKVAG
jgi:predicted lipoprotein